MFNALRLSNASIRTLAACTLLSVLGLACGSGHLVDTTGGFATLSRSDLSIATGANQYEDQSDSSTNCAGLNADINNNVVGNLYCAYKNQIGNYMYN